MLVALCLGFGQRLACANEESGSAPTMAAKVFAYLDESDSNRAEAILQRLLADPETTIESVTRTIQTEIGRAHV